MAGDSKQFVWYGIYTIQCTIGKRGVNGVWNEGYCKFLGDNGFHHCSQSLKIPGLCPVTWETQEIGHLFRNLLGYSIFDSKAVSLGRDESDPLYLIVRTVWAWQGPSWAHLPIIIFIRRVGQNHRVGGRKLFNPIWDSRGTMPASPSTFQTVVSEFSYFNPI